MADPEPPLNCWWGLGDGFSGWYAVSRPDRCDDFCFWEFWEGGGGAPNSTAAPHRYDANNTADPHATTTASNGARWRCALNAAGDETNLDNFNGLLSGVDDFGSTFDIIRCSRGAGARLSTAWSVWASSALFWSLVLLVAVAILLWGRLLISKKDDSAAPQGEAKPLGQALELEDGEEGKSRPRTSPCAGNACRMGVAFVLLNLAAAFGIVASSLSLLEISGVELTSMNFKRLTPACTDPSTICTAANSNVERPSMPRPASAASFSYLIASDPQLDWFAGESAYLGKQNYPPPCSSADSCQACTEQFGQYTNNQLKRSMERLISSDGGPATLVVNGDLTAYFHPSERHQYESVYHHVEGLEQFFPSLGNHDYDHYSGAAYSADEWVFPRRCNAAHSIGYLKGGLCNRIPRFDSDKIARYDSGSLAYSWEEGPYHFVHVHYYPSYENALLGISSSLEWLERDLSLASRQNLTSVLFVHAAQGLNYAMEKVLLGKNVAAIFAGHSHRCLGRKCTSLWALDRQEALQKSSDLEPAAKCVPGTIASCGGNARHGTQSLFYLKDKSDDLVLPTTELFLPPDRSDGDESLCPASIPWFINETDNTLLCRKYVLSPPDFPFGDVGGEKIPIFWSGSASFETFLRADFHDDRLVVNVMTAEAGSEGRRYIDTHEVPNAVYPYHERADLDEVTIFIS